MFEPLIEFFTTLHWDAVLKIIAIDILLGGDNAVIIALACRDLPANLRRKGIFWGTAGAIILRIILVSFAMTLLTIPFLKLIGGILLFWIGIKLLVQQEEHSNVKSSDKLLAAIKTILIADLVMSIDNVIGMAGAAQKADPNHQFGLIIFGILLSIPIVVWGSQVVLKALERFPIIISLGAALLGWIGGGLVISDIFVEKNLNFSVNESFIHIINNINISYMLLAEIIGALFVLIMGKYIVGRKKLIDA